MIKVIVSALILVFSTQSRSEDFSIFDLYEVAEGTKVEVLDPRSVDLKKTLEAVHQMTPSNSDKECDYVFHGTQLNFQQVLKLLPKEFGNKVLRTRTGDRLLKSLSSSSFTVADSSCQTHNYTSVSLVIVENNLKFGLEKSQNWD